MPYPQNVSTAGIDGLYLAGTTLIAVQNGAGRERIVRYRLSAAGDAIEGLDVLESRNPFFRIPTTGVAVAGDFVYLANPNLQALDDEGTLRKSPHLEEVTVLQTPLRQVSTGRSDARTTHARLFRGVPSGSRPWPPTAQAAHLARSRIATGGVHEAESTGRRLFEDPRDPQ
jgi:hypothetical protein